MRSAQYDVKRSRSLDFVVAPIALRCALADKLAKQDVGFRDIVFVRDNPQNPNPASLQLQCAAEAAPSFPCLKTEGY